MSDMTTRQHEKTQFVRCAVLRHAWFEYEGGSAWKPQHGETVFVFRCERCGTERRDRVNRRTGELIPNGRNYIYPDGYKYSRGERPTSDEFRLKLIAMRKVEARRAG